VFPVLLAGADTFDFINEAIPHNIAPTTAKPMIHDADFRLSPAVPGAPPGVMERI